MIGIQRRERHTILSKASPGPQESRNHAKNKRTNDARTKRSSYAYDGKDL